MNDAAFMLPRGNGQIQRRRILPWHDAIIDLLLAEPKMKQVDIAAKLGRTQTTVSLVMNSDVFRHRYAARRAEHARMLSENVITANTRVANKALELTLERLEAGDVAKIPTLQLFSIADKAMERLGYGVKPGVNVQIDNRVQTVSAPADAILNARADIQARERAARQETTTASSEARSSVEPRSGTMSLDEVPSNVLDLEAVSE